MYFVVVMCVCVEGKPCARFSSMWQACGRSGMAHVGRAQWVRQPIYTNFGVGLTTRFRLAKTDAATTVNKSKPIRSKRADRSGLGNIGVATAVLSRSDTTNANGALGSSTGAGEKRRCPRCADHLRKHAGEERPLGCVECAEPLPVGVRKLWERGWRGRREKALRCPECMKSEGDT
jgi:hypothetical protein